MIIIKSDCYRYYGSISIRNRIKCNLLQSGYRYTKTYRRCRALRGKSVILYFILRFLLLRKSHKYGYQISPKVDIGEGFYIGHRGTIIVNENTKIGNNVNIQAGAVIGAENRGKRQGAPSIGNQVWIGSNAVIVGKIKIGNNVLIAPNAYVNMDVDDNSIVIGNPARIIKKDNATEGYIQNIYEK